MAHTLVGVERLFFLLEILFFLGSSIFLVVEFVFLNNNNNIPKIKSPDKTPLPCFFCQVQSSSVQITQYMPSYLYNSFVFQRETICH